MRILFFLLIIVMFSPVEAETLPVTLWQKETRHILEQGDTIRLDRGTFHLVMPLEVGKSIGLVAAASDTRPDKLEAFGPGRGMAGPYDGIFLTWEAFHFFHIDKETGIPRMDLWDRKHNLYHWKVQRFYDNTQSPARELEWTNIPDFTLIFRKEGYEDLTVGVEWNG